MTAQGSVAAAEAPEVRLRRLRMRSWRRGMREMDLILGGFADAALGGLDADGLDAFEALLTDDDGSLYDWVTGRSAPPPDREEIICQICAYLSAK